MRDKLLLYGEKIKNIDIKLQTITKAYHETLHRIDLLSKTYMDILEHLKNIILSILEIRKNKYV